MIFIFFSSKGIRTSEEYGGSNLTCLDASIIYEALSTGCTSTTAFLTIHKYTIQNIWNSWYLKYKFVS